MAEREMDPEKVMQRLAQVAIANHGCDGVISDAITLIERLMPKPLIAGSDEEFVIRALRTAAERTDDVMIMSNDGERLGLRECGSYAARPSSKSVLALLDRLEAKVVSSGGCDC